MERRRGKGQTMSVVIMNGNKVHIGKRFFIIRPVEYQVKYVLGNVLPFIDLQTSLNLKTLKIIIKSSRFIFALQLILHYSTYLYITSSTLSFSNFTSSPWYQIPSYTLTMSPNDPFLWEIPINETPQLRVHWKEKSFRSLVGRCSDAADPCIVSMSDHESFSLIALMQPNRTPEPLRMQGGRHLRDFCIGSKTYSIG